MRQKSGPEKQLAEDAIKAIRRATRRHFSAEDKIRIVLEGLRGDDSIAELCRREGIVQNLYWTERLRRSNLPRWQGAVIESISFDGRTEVSVGPNGGISR
jgi:transposase